MRALIVANGSIDNIDILKGIGQEYDFILAADGGTNHCIEASILPDIIIGDLDSISDEILDISRKNNIPIEKFPAKKDSTDTELAIDYLIDRGYKDISLMGVIGSRMDHTLGNILLLNKLKENKVKGKIINDKNTIYLVEDEITLEKEEDSFVSIIPITNPGINISLKGFEYELKRRDVSFASTFCISNKIIKDRGMIKIHRGEALVFISKD